MAFGARTIAIPAGPLFPGDKRSHRGAGVPPRPRIRRRLAQPRLEQGWTGARTFQSAARLECLCAPSNDRMPTVDQAMLRTGKSALRSLSLQRALQYFYGETGQLQSCTQALVFSFATIELRPILAL